MEIIRSKWFKNWKRIIIKIIIIKRRIEKERIRKKKIRGTWKIRESKN